MNKGNIGIHQPDCCEELELRLAGVDAPEQRHIGHPGRDQVEFCQSGRETRK